MNKKTVTFLYAAAAFFLTIIILLYPSCCIFYACKGLDLWFQKMIPALFPFMVLSGIMIRMNLTEVFAKLLSPFLKPLFHINENCIYAIFVGFLCGFPMGAHVSASLYEHHKISKKEAEFLLSFCNNIGPVYFLSFALPTIHIRHKIPALIGMYGIPFLYGLFLRYFIYGKSIAPSIGHTSSSIHHFTFLQAFDESISSALSNITKLGGYMIIFNLLNAVFDFFPITVLSKKIIGCLLEISGGLTMLGADAPFVALCLIPFGGLSCIAQTYSMIKNTDLSLQKYIFHKLNLTIISCAYYFFLAF